MTGTVWLSPNSGAGVYHTNPDCKHYPENTRALSWADARTSIRECQHCQWAHVE